jgi:hypothetical protein
MRSLMRPFSQSPAAVFDATAEAADRLGYQVSMADRSGGRMFVSVPQRGDRPSGRLSVAVTDSGFATSNLHVSWEARSMRPWPFGRPGRSAARLLRLTNQIVAQPPPEGTS